MYQIHKVFRKKGKVEIHYTKPGDFGQDGLKLESEDQPAPELFLSLQALAAVALREWDLPEAWGSQAQVLGYQGKQSGDAFDYSISLKVKLLTVDDPVLLNLPPKPEPASGLAKEKCLSTETMEAIRQVEREAIKFIDGQRAQGHLNLEPQTI